MAKGPSISQALGEAQYVERRAAIRAQTRTLSAAGDWGGEKDKLGPPSQVHLRARPTPRLRVPALSTLRGDTLYYARPAAFRRTGRSDGGCAGLRVQSHALVSLLVLEHAIQIGRPHRVKRRRDTRDNGSLPSL